MLPLCNVSYLIRYFTFHGFLFDIFFVELNSQHHEVTEQVNEFDQSLKTLEENFDSIKTNKEFKDLQLNLKTIREMMLQANDSNIELHRHMTTIIEHFKILNSPLEQLEKTLPIITELDGRENKKIFISKNYFLSIIQMKQINLN